ncbi:hypothetical protein SFC65_18990 [Priestia filamentosa]|uniref:hypothetical protein n=1 Tax=Priestia filamentosa TaxID=1402861 RepID=UPI003982CD2E
MKKYFGVLSVLILIITMFSMQNDWRVGIAGVVIGFILAMRAPKGIWKYIAYVVLVLCILLFLFLIIMGVWVTAIVDMG